MLKTYKMGKLEGFAYFWHYKSIQFTLWLLNNNIFFVYTLKKENSIWSWKHIFGWWRWRRIPSCLNDFDDDHWKDVWWWHLSANIKALLAFHKLTNFYKYLTQVEHCFASSLFAFAGVACIRALRFWCRPKSPGYHMKYVWVFVSSVWNSSIFVTSFGRCPYVLTSKTLQIFSILWVV